MGIEDADMVKKHYLMSCQKRLLDLVGAFVGLVVGLPILILAILIISVVDRLPPIFSQPRYGLRGLPFIMYKLRTLTVIETPDMLTKDRMEKKPKIDPRCTRTGNFWRINSFDEIPQFWNVLKGEMSLVGYRPFPFYYTSKLIDLSNMDQGKVDNYLKIIASYKPGVTSLSSVRGRSRLTLQEKMEYDLIYASGASLELDIKIMLKTIVVVITQDGAY